MRSSWRHSFVHRYWKIETGCNKFFVVGEQGRHIVVGECDHRQLQEENRLQNGHLQLDHDQLEQEFEQTLCMDVYVQLSYYLYA